MNYKILIILLLFNISSPKGITLINRTNHKLYLKIFEFKNNDNNRYIEWDDIFLKPNYSLELRYNTENVLIEDPKNELKLTFEHWLYIDGACSVNECGNYCPKCLSTIEIHHVQNAEQIGLQLYLRSPSFGGVMSMKGAFKQLAQPGAMNFENKVEATPG